MVALLSFIIIGLVAMFGQTQKALLGSTTQTEVLELGRAATDLLARDLEQLTPGYSLDTNAPNFFAIHEQTPSSPLEAWTQPNNPPFRRLSAFQLPPALPPFQHYLQLLGTNEQRTNVMEKMMFFVTRYNQQWDAIGYRIVTNAAGVGTLYRMYAPDITATNIALNAWRFYNLTDLQVTNGLSRIAEGVVHFRVQAYDPNGYLVSRFSGPNIQAPGQFFGGGIDYNYAFLSNAVPASLEVELGFLETRTLERFKGFGNATLAANYLSNHVGQVHLVRQRISIRNVDPAAYQ